MDHTYTFIDFGSGKGDVLYKLNTYFTKMVGIEIDSVEYNKSLQLLKPYKNINLINNSMENYYIKNENIILYMYEPLWTEHCKYRYKIYNKVLENLINNKNVYVVYITSNGLTDTCDFNQNITNKYILRDVVQSNLWPFNKQILLYKLI